MKKAAGSGKKVCKDESADECGEKKNCLEYFGEDHILWGNDYPYRIDAPMLNIRNYIEGLPLSDGAKAKTMNENGTKLLGL